MSEEPKEEAGKGAGDAPANGADEAPAQSGRGAKTPEERRNRRQNIGCTTGIIAVVCVISVLSGTWQSVREAASTVWDSTGIPCGRSISQGETDQAQELWDDWAEGDIPEDLREEAVHRSEDLRETAAELNHPVVAEIPQYTEIELNGELRRAETDVQTVGDDLHLSIHFPGDFETDEPHTQWEVGVDLSTGSVDWHWTFDDASSDIQSQHTGEYLVTTDRLTRGGTLSDRYGHTEVTAIDPSAESLEGCARFPGHRAAEASGSNVVLTPDRSGPGTHGNYVDRERINVQQLSLPDLDRGFEQDFSNPPPLGGSEISEDLPTRLLSDGTLLAFDYHLSGEPGAALRAGMRNAEADFDTGHAPVRAYDLPEGDQSWTYGEAGDAIGVAEEMPGALDGDDGVLTATLGPFEEQEVRGYDVLGDRSVELEMLNSDGESVWTYQGADYGYSTAPSPDDYVTAYGDVLLVPTGSYEFAALDAATGEELWTLDLPEGDSPWSFTWDRSYRIGDVIYLPSSDERLYALDAHTGENSPETAEAMESIHSHLVHPAGDHTVIASESHRFHGSHIIVDTS